VNKAIGPESKRKELASRNSSSSHMDSQAVTLILASVLSRVCLSTVLVDMVEVSTELAAVALVSTTTLQPSDT
jgi:heme/copper-type cytochrome/quinol oxidase subunit 4